MSEHKARKRFGQHFLVDDGVLAGIAHGIAARADDLMVEIGPGLGALTQWVLPSLNHLHVVEIDRDLANRLRSGKLREKLTVHEVDALAFDFSQLGQRLRVIGNLPYNISSPLLFHLLQYRPFILDQHFMLQKEVIDRMVAQPGSKTFGRLSVMLQAFYDMENIMDVPPEAFDPPPAVMSAVVRMIPLPPDRVQVKCVNTLEALATAAFSQRRKMLRSPLKGKVSAEQAEQVGLDLSLRAEEVGVDTYVALANLLFEAQKG